MLKNLSQPLNTHRICDAQPPHPSRGSAFVLGREAELKTFARDLLLPAPRGPDTVRITKSLVFWQAA